MKTLLKYCFSMLLQDASDSSSGDSDSNSSSSSGSDSDSDSEVEQEPVTKKTNGHGKCYSLSLTQTKTRPTQLQYNLHSLNLYSVVFQGPLQEVTTYPMEAIFLMIWSCLLCLKTVTDQSNHISGCMDVHLCYMILFIHNSHLKAYKAHRIKLKSHKFV